MAPDDKTMSALEGLVPTGGFYHWGIVTTDFDATLERLGECALIESIILLAPRGFEVERLIDRKIMLNLWVKVKSGWSDDDRALRSLGYDDR